MGDIKNRAERNIEWIETHCRIPEGRHVGRPVKLRPWQKKELRKIYNNPHGTRTGILSFARKNGKTALCCFLMLLHLVGPEAKENSQLVSTGQSRDQAALLYNLAAKVVRMSPTIEPYVGLRDSKKQMFCPSLGTLYSALSAEASKNVGSSPIFAIHDELGQVKGPRSQLFEAVETGMGAHENPLSIIISTQAPTDADLLSILIDDAKAGYDPRVTLGLYTTPKDDDPFLVKSMRKSNPAYGDFLNDTEVKRLAADAKRMPSREPGYRNYNLNQRVDASSVFVSATVWNANGDKPVEDFGRRTVYGGLDLSAVQDLTALSLICDIDGEWHNHNWFWLPEHGLREKAQKDRVPYDVWRDQGFLTVTPGQSIEYSWVAYQLRQIFDTYNIGKIAFDRWNWRALRPWLVEAGFKDHELDRFVEFGQGYQSMSPALREFETILLASRLRHGMNPILNMCAANAVVQTDPAGNRKLAKDKSSGRIDGMVSLTQAIGVAAEKAVSKFVTGRLVTA